MAVKGSKLYSNGVIEKYFNSTDIIPTEFKEVKIIYINDGINNKRWYSNKELPEGYILGKLPLSRNWAEEQHKHHSEETKKKISEKRKEQGSPWAKDFKHSQETKDFLSNLNKGKDPWNKSTTLSKEQNDKRIQSIENHFGSLEEFYKHKQELIRDKYGISNFSQLNVKKYSEELFELHSDRDKSIQFLTEHKFTRNQLAEYFNCPTYIIDYWSIKLDLRDYINHPPYSHYEQEIIDLFPEAEFEHNNRTILNGKEIDLYSEKYKLGIEFNGTYWHSSLNISSPTYHQIKSKLCEQAGIRLIHIYEYEWTNDRLKTLIKYVIKSAIGDVSNKVYARQCSVKKLLNITVENFINQCHLQGHRNAQITYGLFYKEELVQIMSFSKNRKYEWEIIRECTKPNTLVVGGVSKLFKHFIKEYNPNEVFSYCDFNKFTGKSYEKLGMKFIGYTQPDLKFIINGKVYNRNPNRNTEQQSKSEAKIYGAGSKKYLWTKNET